MQVIPAESSIPKGSLGVWYLAWPSIVTNLLYATSSIFAIKIVGNLGPDAIAATVTGQRVNFILQAILTGILAGTTALISRNWGAKKYDNAAEYLTSTLQLVIVVSSISGLLLWVFTDEVVSIFLLEENAHKLSVVYLKYLSPFFPFFGAGIGLITALRAVGDVRTPLAVAIVMNGVAVSVMYVLVNGHLGFASYGVLGAAIGNGLSFLFGFLVLFSLWYSNVFKIKSSKLNSINKEKVFKILDVGYPSALEQIVFQIGITAFLILISTYGTKAYAAYGIGVQLLSFSFVIGFGFSIAGSTLVGQHLGANDRKQAIRSGWGSMRLSMGSMTIFGLLIVFFAQELSALMVDDQEVIRLTVLFIYLLGSMQPLMAIEFSIGGALRGAGDTRTPFVITVTCLIFIRVLLALVLYIIDAKVEYIFATLLMDYIVKGGLFLWAYRSMRWLDAYKFNETD